MEAESIISFDPPFHLAHHTRAAQKQHPLQLRPGDPASLGAQRLKSQEQAPKAMPGPRHVQAMLRWGSWGRGPRKGQKLGALNHIDWVYPITCNSG